MVMCYYSLALLGLQLFLFILDGVTNLNSLPIWGYLIVMQSEFDINNLKADFLFGVEILFVLDDEKANKYLPLMNCKNSIQVESDY